MLLRCVVGDEIKDDFEAKGVSLLDQAFAIFKRAEAGIDVEYERIGGLVVAESEAELAALRPAFDGYRRHGVPVEWLDAAGARACEPAFASDRVLGRLEKHALATAH